MIGKTPMDTVAARPCHHSMAQGADGHRGHQLQFYNEEEHLHGVLSNYFAPFLIEGESFLGAIVLGRVQTRAYLRDRLLQSAYTSDEPVDNGERRPNGCECATPISTTYRRGQRKMILVDADMVVAKLVQGDELDASSLDKMLEELVPQLIPGSSQQPQQQGCHEPPIYAYGELVDILCARGQHLLAFELELFWNRFLATASMILLCGYKMDSFRDLQAEDMFDQICHSHTAVTPTETYSNLATSQQQLAMIAALEQKALTLHSKQWPSVKVDQRIRHREQFVETICHELRNPVCGIVGNVELLQAGLDVRQAILRPFQSERGDENLQLSSADALSLRDQLTNDLISIDAITACATHIKTVSDDVLSLSKLEEGKVVLAKAPFDPKATITSVIKMFSIQAQKKGILLVEDLPIETLLVLGDPGRLAQIVTNLISNAIKFTNAGSITVRLRPLGTTTTDGGSFTFKVAVRDTGCGLSRDEIALLFHRFAQLPSTSFSRDGGSGLGLYISKHLVELMGGAMWVESQVGGGSTFFFTFKADLYFAAKDEISWLHLDDDCVGKRHKTAVRPSPAHGIDFPTVTTLPRRPIMSRSASEGSICLSPPSPRVPLSLTDVAPATCITPHHQQARHVLVVDDNPIVLRTIIRILKSSTQSSLSVSAASNGYEAVSKLITFHESASPIDLILMDLDMPFMDGLKAAREIRHLANHYPERGRSVRARQLADTPIIGLTGDIREERFAEARLNGMDECIKKPIVKATLLELVESVMRRRWRRRRRRRMVAARLLTAPEKPLMLFQCNIVFGRTGVFVLLNLGAFDLIRIP